jgi:hypothetical protein
MSTTKPIEMRLAALSASFTTKPIEIRMAALRPAPKR